MKIAALSCLMSVVINRIRTGVGAFGNLSLFKLKTRSLDLIMSRVWCDPGPDLTLLFTLTPP